jgi:hypothetical protein
MNFVNQKKFDGFFIIIRNRIFLDQHRDEEQLYLLSDSLF